jgi:hypothetical protein
MIRARAWILGAILFGVGNLSGAGLTRWYGAVQLQQIFAPDGFARHRVLKLVLTKRLKLDARQQAELETILGKQDGAWTAAQQPCEAKLGELRADLVRDLSVHIDAAQQAKLKEIAKAAEPKPR